ncbi:MAG TPA: hypothetical protein VGC14_20415 [Rhizobium sp.]
MMTDPVTAAAQWLADQQETPQQVIHLLREKFGITGAEAAQACTLANKFRIARRAHS